MPIYEYNCGDCNEHLEVLIRTDKDVPTQCPKCGSKKIAKGFSAFAVTSPSSPGLETCPSSGSPCQPSGGCASGGGCPFS